MPVYPRWVDETDGVFLREVARNLFVGAEAAAFVRSWDLIVDLHGNHSPEKNILVVPFADGDEIPHGALTEIYSRVERALDSGQEVLICCKVGRSRSASVAYAILRVCYGVKPGDAHERISTLLTIPTGRRTLSFTYPLHRTFQSASSWAESRVDELTV